MMRTALTLAAKDLRLLLRNRGASFFAFGWPVIVAVMFGLVFGGGGAGKGAIPVVLVDEDGSADSRAFVDLLASGRQLNAIRARRSEAEELVRKGARSAAIVVLPGFGDARKRMFYGEPPKVLLIADPTREAESGLLEGVLFQAAAAGLEDLFDGGQKSRELVSGALAEIAKEPETAELQRTAKFLADLDAAFAGFAPAATATPAAANGEKSGGFTPVSIEKKDAGIVRAGPRNPFEVTFPQGILWGLIGCASTFGVGLVEERTTGTLVRLRMSPLRPGQVLFGRALACFLAILIVETLLILLGTLVFRIRISSPAAFLGGALATAVCFVGIASFVSILGKTPQSASGTAWAILLPMSMLGGGMIPLFAMPEWMQHLSRLSPVRWAILSLEGGLWRGFTLAEAAIPCTVLVVVGIVTFVLGARAFRVE